MFLNDEFKARFEELMVKIEDVFEDIKKFSSDLNEDIQKKKIVELEAKHDLSVGEVILWRGVKVKVIGFRDDMPTVSVILSENKISPVTHKLTSLHDIERFGRELDSNRLEL